MTVFPMIPLHVHSNYSLLKGTLTLDGLVSSAKESGLKSLSLTDLNSMSGLIQFAKKCNEEKIKPILGAEIDDPKETNLSAVFLAKNNKGYSELCKIITSRKLNDDFSLIKIVNIFNENLFVITSSIELLRNINPGPNIFAELIASKRLKNRTRRLYNYALENNIKFVASNPVYFLEKDDFLIHKLVTAIRLNTTFDNLDPNELVDEEFYWKDQKTLDNIWKALPEAVKMTEVISDQCNVDLKLGEYKYPVFNLPDNESSYALLWNEVYEGFKINYPNMDKIALDRLEFELSVIKQMNLVDYFLIVWDIVKEARNRGMLMIGRGSAANSIVAYCLGLTQVDPIKYNLFFERFLNKARNSPPDIDIDFSWKERDEIVKYVFNKYGYENVAMISTIVTFRAKSAFREVAKAFGFTNTEISNYSKFIPWTNAGNLQNISELFPESRKVNFKIEPWKSIIELASKLADFPRHLSIHPCGIIVTPGPVTDYVALEYAKNKGLGLIITQTDMYSIEDIGLIKIDLLSQRSLGVLRDTVYQIENNGSISA
jgi:DNA polymerase III alpha subunit